MKINKKQLKNTIFKRKSNQFKNNTNGLQNTLNQTFLYAIHIDINFLKINRQLFAQLISTLLF